jgi:hypothetical protein
MPVGYRFLADEWLPDGWHLEGACQFAKTLTATEIAYLDVPPNVCNIGGNKTLNVKKMIYDQAAIFLS